MARPVPIIIPGPTGMGGTMKRRKVNLGIGALLAFYDKFIAEPKRRREAAPGIQKLLGTETVQGMQTPGVEQRFNLPGDISRFAGQPSQRPVLSIENILNMGRTQLGAEALKNLLKPKERRIIKDVAGVQRFPDTGERVFPGVTEPTDKALAPILKSFEDYSKIDPKLRGTNEYETALTAYRTLTEGRNQLAATTPDGQIVTFNTVSGKITTTDAPTLLPKTKKMVSDETAGQIATMDSLISGIKDIRKIALDRPEFLGPVQGRWNKLKSKFVDNQDFVELDRQVESLITLAYALSGKQISEKEMTMLKAAILPAVTQPGANFMVALDHAENWITVNRDNRIKRLKDFGFFTGTGREKTIKTKPKISTEDRVKQIIKQNPNIDEAIAIEQALDEEFK